MAFGLGLCLIGLGIVEVLVRLGEGATIAGISLPENSGSAAARLVPVFDPPGLKVAMRVLTPGDTQRGWHENQSIPPKQPGEKVIVCVGDSLTYGLSVQPQAAWPAVIRASFPSTVTIYNFGVPGYDVEQVATLVRTRLAAYQPDLLVWGAYTNDAMPTYLYRGAKSGLPVFVGSRIPPSAQFLPEALALPLVHHSAIFRAVQGAYFDQHVSVADAAEPYPGWYEERVDEIVNWTGEQGVKLVVLAMAPHVLADPETCRREEQSPGFCAQHEEAYRRFTRDFQERGLTWADGLAALQATGKPSFFTDHREDVDHPNAEGYAVFARTVLPAVQAALR